LFGGINLKNTDAEKFIKKWSRDRQKGKNSYVLINSIILGITMSLTSTALKFVKGDKVHLDFVYFIGGFLGGLIVMRYGWSKNEEKYNKLMSKKL